MAVRALSDFQFEFQVFLVMLLANKVVLLKGNLSVLKTLTYYNSSRLVGKALLIRQEILVLCHGVAALFNKQASTQLLQLPNNAVHNTRPSIVLIFRKIYSIFISFFG